MRLSLGPPPSSVPSWSYLGLGVLSIIIVGALCTGEVDFEPEGGRGLGSKRGGFEPKVGGEVQNSGVVAPPILGLSWARGLLGY